MLSIFFLIFVIFSGNALELHKNNMSCTLSSDCDLNRFDVCESGSCECQSWALYDQILGVCRIRAGYFCHLPTRPCIENANCTGQIGKCLCNPGFKEDSDGICIFEEPKLDDQEVKPEIEIEENEKDFYNKGCTYSRDCKNPLHFLRCFENKCVCHESDIFDQNSKICRAPPNRLCFPPKNPCVQNATCGSIVIFGICLCDDGFEVSRNNSACTPIGTSNETNGTEKKSEVKKQTSLGKTPGFYGKSCLSHVDCQNRNLLFCNEGQCTCERNTSVWDEILEICRSKVGEFCYPPNDPCIENSVCVDSVCFCDNGFVKNDENNCIPISVHHKLDEIIVSHSNFSYAGWILSFVLLGILCLFVGILIGRKFKNSLTIPTWPIAYKHQMNEDSCSSIVQIN